MSIQVLEEHQRSVTYRLWQTFDFYILKGCPSSNFTPELLSDWWSEISHITFFLCEIGF